MYTQDMAAATRAGIEGYLLASLLFIAIGCATSQPLAGVGETKEGLMQGKKSVAKPTTPECGPQKILLRSYSGEYGACISNTWNVATLRPNSTTEWFAQRYQERPFFPPPFTYPPSFCLPPPFCASTIDFEYFPGIDTDYARKLVGTESIEITTRIRHWHELEQRNTKIHGHTTLLLTSEYNEQIFLISLDDGVLLIFCGTGGGLVGVPLCNQDHSKTANEVVAGFKTCDMGMEKAKKQTANAKPPAIKKLPKVPTNLEECFAELKIIIPPEKVTFMRTHSEEDMGEYHLGLGMYLRNEWGLRSDSPLAKYFYKLGIHNADDMSGIILDSFWRHLNNKPIDLEGQIKRYKTPQEPGRKGPKRPP